MRFTMLVACVMLVGCGGPGRPTPSAAEEVPPVSATVEPPPDAAAPDASVEAPDAGPDATGAAAPAPPPAPAQVSVAFSIRPQVGERPPLLHVSVRNPNPTPVPLTRFDDPACFMRHYLAIEVRRPDGTPLVERPCVVKTWPGIEGQLAPNQTATIELPLAKLFEGLVRGPYEIDIDWDPARLDEVRPGTGVTASTTSQDVQTFIIAKVLASFRIERGKTVALPGGLRLTFRAHGHKHVMAGGPSSPLIIHGALATTKGAGGEFSVNVFTDETRLFSIGDYAFELVAHDYDGWMQLRYFGKLALD